MSDQFNLLHQLADNYRLAQQQLADTRAELDREVIRLKHAGYSFPALARETQLAQGTIQNIVNPDMRPTARKNQLKKLAEQQ